MGGTRRKGFSSQHDRFRHSGIYSGEVGGKDSMIEAKSRTFLVKVKVHRGEPLNEGGDDLIQKAVLNRMVTVLERDQSHKTPVITTWTTSFLTREGEGHKAMGDRINPGEPINLVLCRT